MSGVSVAIPITGRPRELPGALQSIEYQSYTDLDIMLLLNGAGLEAIAEAESFARRDRRVRIMHRPAANLAAALNTALRAARFDLVARMDADDESHPDRLARQVEHLAEHPRITVLGTAYERIDALGNARERVTPPCDPAEIRWRLLLNNTFAHGSVVLRRPQVLSAGGYDERCHRAQDYDLWLRLAGAHDLANLSEVLYRYRADALAGPIRPDHEQARTSARAMVRAWQSLSLSHPGTVAETDALVQAIAAIMSGSSDASRAVAGIESALQDTQRLGISLTAWLWAQWYQGLAPKCALDAMRASRVRERSADLDSIGIDALWLWGAGAHTTWLLDHQHLLTQEILGIIDDHRAGRSVHGYTVQSPDAVPAEAHVLLSSDWYEESLWIASESARARGVTVHRLYDEQPLHQRA